MHVDKGHGSSPEVSLAVTVGRPTTTAQDLCPAYPEIMEADIRHLRLRTGITVPCLVQDNSKDD
ncbi:MAG: hypothetical protein ACLGIS_07855, partial [Actinomycetes bacterium]